MESVQQALAALVGRPDVRGAAFVSSEGLPLASRLPDATDTEALAALAAGLLRDSGQLADALGRPAGERLVLDGPDGLVLVCRLGDGAGLVVLASPDGDAGSLLYHLRQQQPALAAIL